MPSSRRASLPKVFRNWMNMRNNLSQEGLYINDFHRRNSMAAQREVLRMLLHPCSREQKIRQIEMLHQMSEDSKESSNEERRKQVL